MTPEAIGKLEEGFMMDFTVEEACLFAGISTDSYYSYLKKNPEFANRKKLLNNNVAMKAKNNIASSINRGSEPDSKWWLERRRKDEFSTRSENTGIDGKAQEFNLNISGIKEKLLSALTDEQIDEILAGDNSE
ncbi:MAG: hypothetical protein KDE20_19675 [Caldilineaceae bacterium]|nr:hypothetical protein [Caldilineaceae bacterium]